MKNQALFSSKDKSKKLKCCLLQFLFAALRVNTHGIGSTCTILILLNAAGCCILQKRLRGRG